MRSSRGLHVPSVPSNITAFTLQVVKFEFLWSRVHRSLSWTGIKSQREVLCSIWEVWHRDIELTLISSRQCFEWHGVFKNDRTSLEDLRGASLSEMWFGASRIHSSLSEFVASGIHSSLSRVLRQRFETFEGKGIRRKGMNLWSAKKCIPHDENATYHRALLTGEFVVKSIISPHAIVTFVRFNTCGLSSLPQDESAARMSSL